MLGRHLAFHVRLAGRAHAGLTGGQPEPWVARLGADLDDLRAAMDRATATGELGTLVDITEPIVRFWFEGGLTAEVHRRLHDAAAAPGIPGDERVRGLTTAAALALAGSEPASAFRSASKAVDAARTPSLFPQLGAVHSPLGPTVAPPLPGSAARAQQHRKDPTPDSPAFLPIIGEPPALGATLAGSEVLLFTPFLSM